MEAKTKRSIITHYSKLYKKFGDSPKSIGWTKGKQELRFNAVTGISNLKKTSVLDIGCGFGDLAAFLNKKKLNVRYTGVDINEKFIEIAKKKYPKKFFEVRDVEKNPYRKKFDWVFAIGTTNHSGSYKYIEKLLTEMFHLCRKGVVMDFLTTYVDYMMPGNFHASPEHIFKIAKKLSKKVVIRHDYLPFEFCVYVYKSDKITKNTSFSNL